MSRKSNPQLRALRGTPIADRTTDEIILAVAQVDLDKPDSVKVETAMMRLRDYAREEHIGSKELADRSGISNSSISEMFNGIYGGNWVTRAAAIEEFFHRLEKLDVYGGIKTFVETDVARSIWRICERTRYNCRMQPLQSPEQLGKTRALEVYTASNNSGRTIMVTLEPGLTSNPMGIFVRSLAEALGICIHNRQILQIRNLIKQRLTACNLVILDEFHMVDKWPDKSVADLLDYLRIVVHNNGARGILMVATNSDIRTMLAAFKRRTNYNLGQLQGRMCNEVLSIEPADIPRADVALLAARYGKLNRKTIDLLHDVATRRNLGHFGLILDILDRCWSDCKLDDIPLTDAIVKTKISETLADLKAQDRTYE